MATKKKTEKDELTKVDITHADVNDGMAAPEQEALSEMEKVNATAQVHITVVIPYCREFAQGRELLYALRSWQENVRFGINVVVIGDVRLGSAKKLPLSSISVYPIMRRLIHSLN